MKYRVGDELILKVIQDFGYSDKTYRHVKVQIISDIDPSAFVPEYLVYVPSYESLEDSFVMQQHHVTRYGVDRKFIGDQIAFISANHPIYMHMPTAMGEKCERCREFFSGACASEGAKFKCQACTRDPWR